MAFRRIVALILALAALPVGLARAQYLGDYDFPATGEIRGENIWLRVDPAAETEIVTYLQRGDEVTLTGEAVAADGIAFVPVQTNTGEAGWVRDLAIDPRSLVAQDEPASSEGDDEQTQGAIEATASAGATIPPAQDATSAQETPPLGYDVATEEVIEAPNGRTRIEQRIVISESGTPDVLAATLADAARQGLQEHPEAIVSAVFAYRPGDDIGSSFTVGRASVSRDGQGLDPGSDNLLIGPDDGRVQVEVATEVVEDIPIETEVSYFPSN